MILFNFIWTPVRGIRFTGGLCVGSATRCHNFVQAPAPPHTLKGQKVSCCVQKLENTTVPVIS